MRIKLENIGMLKEADVKIDGLTVIAGENDTGKSTVAKAFYTLLLQINQEMPTVYKVFGDNLLVVAETKAKATLIDEKQKIEKSFKIEIIGDSVQAIENSKPNTIYSNTFFIETPSILSIAKYIKNTNLFLTQYGYKFFIPLYTTDLILRLSQGFSEKNKTKLFKNIKETICGEVFYDSQKDDFYFKKNKLKNPINMHSTASGIKMFGFLQILVANGSLKEGSVLILDEPEVHLHPKWQLKYAEIIVELVKNGIYVLVNSHSPYMIEALKVYSDKMGISDKTNFYLAESEDGITAAIKDTTNDLESIFAKLAEPYRLFDKMALDKAFAK